MRSRRRPGAEEGNGAFGAARDPSGAAEDPLVQQR